MLKKISNVFRTGPTPTTQNKIQELKNQIRLLENQVVDLGNRTDFSSPESTTVKNKIDHLIDNAKTLQLVGRIQNTREKIDAKGSFSKDNTQAANQKSLEQLKAEHNNLIEAQKKAHQKNIEELKTKINELKDRLENLEAEPDPAKLEAEPDPAKTDNKQRHRYEYKNEVKAIRTSAEGLEVRKPQNNPVAPLTHTTRRNSIESPLSTQKKDLRVNNTLPTQTQLTPGNPRARKPRTGSRVSFLGQTPVSSHSRSSNKAKKWDASQKEIDFLFFLELMLDGRVEKENKKPYVLTLTGCVTSNDLAKFKKKYDEKFKNAEERGARVAELQRLNITRIDNRAVCTNGNIDTATQKKIADVWSLVNSIKKTDQIDQQKPVFSRERAQSAPPTLSPDQAEFPTDLSKIESALKNSKTLPQEKTHGVRKISLHLHDSELNELERIAFEEYKKDLKKTTFPFFSKKESEFEYKNPGDFLEFSKTNDRAFKYVLATQKLFEKRFKDPSYQHERAVAARANHQEYEKNLKEIAKQINSVLEKNISLAQIHKLVGLLKNKRQEDYLTIVREIVKIQPEEKDYEKQIRFCGFLSAFGLENFSSAREITNKTKNIILNQLNNSVDLESFGLAFQENLISGMLVSVEKFKEKLDKLHESSAAFKIPSVLEEHQKAVMQEAEYTAEILLSPTENNSRKVTQDAEELGFNEIKTDYEQFLRDAASSAASSVGAPSTLPSNVSALFQPSRDNAELCKVKKALSPVFESMMEIYISENNEEITLIPAIFFCENPGFAYKHKESFDHCVACAKTLYTVLNNNSPSEQKTAELIRICSTQIDAKEILNFNSDFHSRLLKTKENLTSLKSPTSSLQAFPSVSSLPTL